jgi:hypothetical protein
MREEVESFFHQVRYGPVVVGINFLAALVAEFSQERMTAVFTGMHVRLGNSSRYELRSIPPIATRIFVLIARIKKVIAPKDYDFSVSWFAIV